MGNGDPTLWSYLAGGRRDIGDARMEVEFGNVSHQYLLFGQAEGMGGYKCVHMRLWLRDVVSKWLGWIYTKGDSGLPRGLERRSPFVLLAFLSVYFAHLDLIP